MQKGTNVPFFVGKIIGKKLFLRLVWHNWVWWGVCDAHDASWRLHLDANKILTALKFCITYFAWFVAK